LIILYLITVKCSNFTEIESGHVAILQVCYIIVQEKTLNLKLDNIIDGLNNVASRDAEHLQKFSRRA